MNKIAIHSVPRSGSSWIGQIFNSSPDVNFKFQPLFSYEFKDHLSENSSKQEIDSFFSEIANCNTSFLIQQDKIDQGIYPKFDKNKTYKHIVYKEVRYHHILRNLLSENDDVIGVGIIRNPYSVINSFLKSPREFRKDLGWIEDEEWRFAPKKNLDRKEEFFGYEKWKEVVKIFNELKEIFPKRVYLIKYDELILNPEEHTKKLFSFCGIEYSEQTKDFLYNSRKSSHDDVYSVYRKKKTDNGWMKTLPLEIALSINHDLLGDDAFSEFVLSSEELDYIHKQPHN